MSPLMALELKCLHGLVRAKAHSLCTLTLPLREVYLQVARGSLLGSTRCQSVASEAGMAVASNGAIEHSKSGSRAVVVGGGLAGLASASVLSGLFDEVILLERDSISTQQASNHNSHAHKFLVLTQKTEAIHESRPLNLLAGLSCGTATRSAGPSLGLPAAEVAFLGNTK